MVPFQLLENKVEVISISTGQLLAKATTRQVSTTGPGSNHCNTLCAPYFGIP